MKSIKMLIDKEGNIKIGAVGFTGATAHEDGHKASAPYEVALGKVSQRELRGEQWNDHSHTNDTGINLSGQ